MSQDLDELDIDESYYEDRKENVREQVSTADVLRHFGIDLPTADIEVQYACPLHGDGQDLKKSARYYPQNDSTYCFGCDAYRDQFDLVMAFEGGSFMEAVKYLERQFDVEDAPNIYEYANESAQSDLDSAANDRDEELSDLETSKSTPLPPEQLKALERRIDRLCQTYRDQLTGTTVAQLYHVYDRLTYDLDHDRVDPSDARQAREAFQQKLQELESHFEPAV